MEMSSDGNRWKEAVTETVPTALPEVPWSHPRSFPVTGINKFFLYFGKLGRASSVSDAHGFLD